MMIDHCKIDMIDIQNIFKKITMEYYLINGKKALTKNRH